ncbi:MAG: hypothetical protein U9O56_05800 [Campylobacterota bacterium]|nr:hypothetical protein [Campylobacterota bacterium]
MIKVLLTIFLSAYLFSFDKVTASKILETVFLGIENKVIKNIKIEDEQYKDVLNLSDKFNIVSNIKSCDILVFDKSKDLNNLNLTNKILFATSYNAFRNRKDAIGAFYWFKGRPQIIFLDHRLKEKNISLKPYLQKYITDEL